MCHRKCNLIIIIIMTIIWTSALYISYRFDTAQYFKMKRGKNKLRSFLRTALSAQVIHYTT